MSRQKSTPQMAMAAEHFDHFCSAGSMRQILSLHRAMCDVMMVKPSRLPDFYPKVKAMLERSWKAQALFKKFDTRANHKVYAKGAACPNTRVLIIGAGPCGLRAAIECQLLGAKVVVIEKRDRMSRNNVLHLWPLVIHDLRALGAKKFYGKFCAGAIDHISIRQLQCILLKVCLLLGVEFHEGVSFEELLEPMVADNGEVLGWRGSFSPAEHLVSHYEFDTLIGADGKRNTLRGFKRKDFRGKLAIAITANFINRHSVQEASVEEISGVAFIFRQKFFKDMYSDTGIDLENIVYYKDETHYFVMTAKKHSLLQKGVLKHDNPETSKLLSPGNVDRDALQRYARQAAQYSTEDCLQHLDFALNHYGEPDVTLFDFTSMYAAENASMVLERNGRRLLCCLVGDSLLEPFWPTGSGCARGFLSALDAAWAVRAWGQTPSPHPITVLMERESIYRLLAQTTPENLHRDLGAYTLDPRTRYPNLNRAAVTAHRVAGFYNSDDPLPLDASATMRKRKREIETSEQALVDWMRRAVAAAPGAGEQVDGEALGLRWAVSPPALAALLRRYRPDLMPPDVADVAAYAVLTDLYDIAAMGPTRNAIRGDVSEVRMRHFLREVYHAFKGEVPHVHREINIAPEVEQSENGNHQEERRGDVNRRYKKKKSRATHVSNTLVPSMEMLIGQVGKLGIVKPCGVRVHRDRRLIATPEPVGASRRRSRSASPRTCAVVATNDPLHRARSASLMRPELHAQTHETSRPTKKTQRSDLEEGVPERRVKRHDAPNDSMITNLRLKWETRESQAATSTSGAPEKPHRALRSSPWELRESLLEAKRRTKHKESHASKRRTARDIARFQFEKSSRLLATTPSVSAVDHDNDYGMQQYRAAAPEFGTRVKTLEKQLFNIDEGRTAINRTRTAATGAGSGATVARLAAELSRSDKRGPPPPRAKPRDLLRSIGRIEPSDWNVQSIEKQIKENKLGRPQPKQAERVPKWDREKFEARQQRLKQASAAVEEPPGELEQVVQHINMLRRDSGRPAQGTSKVARLAEGFSKKPTADTTPLVPQGKPWTAAAAELVAASAAPCVVCNTRVFAAESVIADGLTVHRRCFRCAACRVALSAGSFLIMGNCLTCTHHSPNAITETTRPEAWGGVAGRPAESAEREEPAQASSEMCERITLEASNASAEMDEDEWAGRNFLASETSCAGGLSDESSSEDEYTEAGSCSLESDLEEGEAGGSPKLPEEGAMRRHIDVYISQSDDDEDESCDESGSSLGGSPELAAAREARRREVPPPSTHPHHHTDSSEVESEEESESETETSSATEVSTDSEFGPDESVPAKTPPAITVTGPAACPTRPAPPPPLLRPHRPPDPTEYPLSRTRSAGGLATKRALELKRLYLLGEPTLASVRRSDSTSRLDSRIESFHNNISQFQKLLNPAPSPDPPPEHPPRPTELTLKSFTIDSSKKIFITDTKKKPPTTDNDEKPVPESQIETDSLSDDSSSSATKTGPSPPVPRLEVHDASGELVQLDSLIIVDAPPARDICTDVKVIPTKAESESSESCRDATTLALTETELSDWAADGGILDDMGLEERPEYNRRQTSARNPRVLSAPKNIHDTKNIAALSAHVCGRDEEPVLFSNATDYFEFADEGEDVSISTIPLRNAGYMEFVDEDYRQTEDRSIGFIEHTSSCIESPSAEPYIECSPVQPKLPALVEEPVKISPEEPMSPVVPDSETPTITELSSMLYNNGQLSLSKSSFTNLTEMSSSTADSEDTSAPVTVDVTRSFSFSTPLTLLISVPYQQMTDESPLPPPPHVEVTTRRDELKRERQQQTEVVRRLVMERIGGTPVRKSSRRARVSAPATTAAPPPPPRPPPPPPPRLMPSMSDPELTRVRRRRGIIRTVADFFNRRAATRKKVWEDWECSCAVGLRVREPRTGEYGRRREHSSAAHLPVHAMYCCPSAARNMQLKQKQEDVTTSPPLPPPPPPLSACSSE